MGELKKHATASCCSSVRQRGWCMKFLPQFQGDSSRERFLKARQSLRVSLIPDPGQRGCSRPAWMCNSTPKTCPGEAHNNHTNVSSNPPCPPTPNSKLCITLYRTPAQHRLVFSDPRNVIHKPHPSTNPRSGVGLLTLLVVAVGEPRVLVYPEGDPCGHRTEARPLVHALDGRLGGRRHVFVPHPEVPVEGGR